MTSSCVWADTECFVVTRLGYRWALTLAPPYVQLIWTLTGCQTCWSEHLCFLRSEMRVKSQSISTEETWVCTGHDLVRDEGVGPGRVTLMSFQHCVVKLDFSNNGALDVSSRAWSHGSHLVSRFPRHQPTFITKLWIFRGGLGKFLVLCWNLVVFVALHEFGAKTK